jgi:hypothetical protein
LRFSWASKTVRVNITLTEQELHEIDQHTPEQGWRIRPFYTAVTPDFSLTDAEHQPNTARYARVSPAQPMWKKNQWCATPADSALDSLWTLCMLNYVPTHLPCVVERN